MRIFNNEEEKIFEKNIFPHNRIIDTKKLFSELINKITKEKLSKYKFLTFEVIILDDEKIYYEIFLNNTNIVFKLKNLYYSRSIIINKKNKYEK